MEKTSAKWSQTYDFEKAAASAADGLRSFVPKVSLQEIKTINFLPHLKLLPYDILIILFIGQAMLPAWAAAFLVIVNVGTWWCYYRIPQFLRTISGPGGESILIPGGIVEHFAQFINSCGIHHRAHYGLMFAMMAGFHAQMTGHLWDKQVPDSFAALLAWSSYAALLLVDFTMYWVSVRTLQELRKDKLEEANQYTEDLKRSNEELEQFAYIASHDLRSPLRGIITLSKWIENDVRDTCTEDTRKNLKLLKSRTQRMYNLLNDLLQYSRIGRVETAIENVNPAEIAQEIFDSLTVDDKFNLFVTGADIEVTDHRIPYEMILANLITNAVKHHHHAHGNIWVSIDKVGQNIILDVEDDGPGIPEDYKEKIFDIFTTLHRRDEKEATGMGLAIIKKILLHKGGSVIIDDSVHGGTHFKVTIPVVMRE